MLSGARTAELQSLFSILPFGIILFSAENSIIYSNPPSSALLGVDSDALNGKSDTEFAEMLNAKCHPDMNPRPYTAELDTEGRAFFLNTAPLRVVHCVTLNIHNLARDQTNKLVYLRDATREFETDRLRGEFLAKAAHQLRTPLTNILGFTELLLAQAYDTKTRTDILGTIHRQSLMLKELLNDLLQLARIEAHQGAEFRYILVPFDKVISNAIEQSKDIIGNRDLRVEQPGSWPTIRCDQANVTLALINLISNAVKFSDSTAPVEIRSRHQTRDGVEYFGVEIVDSGIGISAEEISRTGERFFRSDSVSEIQGNGLGMTVAKEIVEIHKGWIEINSELNVGTAVTLWLPVAVNARIREDQ